MLLTVFPQVSYSLSCSPRSPIVSAAPPGLLYSQLPAYTPALDQHSTPALCQYVYSAGSSLCEILSPLIINKGLNCQVSKSGTSVVVLMSRTLAGFCKETKT
uniref:Uncharacterized protein n=1 Tax=Mus musculus TaxID=10090 RepID=Q3T988_MOUSE|nr:unnamed protein product [Mus musculus]